MRDRLDRDIHRAKARRRRQRRLHLVWFLWRYVHAVRMKCCYRGGVLTIYATEGLMLGRVLLLWLNRKARLPSLTAGASLH